MKTRVIEFGTFTLLLGTRGEPISCPKNKEPKIEGCQGPSSILERRWPKWVELFNSCYRDGGGGGSGHGHHGRGDHGGVGDDGGGDGDGDHGDHGSDVMISVVKIHGPSLRKGKTSGQNHAKPSLLKPSPTKGDGRGM